MAGINDSDEDLMRMSNLLLPYREHITIKISYLNYTRPGEANNLFSPSRERFEEIKDYLSNRSFDCYIFGTFKNTELGCGQLAQNHISSKE